MILLPKIFNVLAYVRMGENWLICYKIYVFEETDVQNNLPRPFDSKQLRFFLLTCHEKSKHMIGSFIGSGIFGIKIFGRMNFQLSFSFLE